MSESRAMTLREGKCRKPLSKLLIAKGRYVTRGAPRSGGLAAVYQATDTDSGDTVALKVFKTGEGTDPVIEESFRREVQALTDLKHPNIVRILDSGRDVEADLHYVVMEWVDADLRQLCERESRWPPGVPAAELKRFCLTSGLPHLDGPALSGGREQRL